jgi:hypothetical protein
MLQEPGVNMVTSRHAISNVRTLDMLAELSDLRPSRTVRSGPRCLNSQTWNLMLELLIFGPALEMLVLGLAVRIVRCGMYCFKCQT